jgi:hypothetical protein
MINRNYTMILVMVALAAASFQLSGRWSQPAEARAQLGDGSVKFIKGDIPTYVWAITRMQRLRVCAGSQSSAAPTESFSLNFTKIKNQAGDVILEKQAQVPAGEFRCNYYSHEELIAAGLDPDPTTGATPPFLVVVGSERVGTNRTTNVGAAETITVGAVQSINVATGKIELQQSFKSFQIISAGRN